jgi:hypothetical protein
MGLMLAPYSGRTMRARINGAVADGGAQVKECGETVRVAVLNAVEHTTDAITLHKEGIVGAIKRGSQVYRRAVG